ncbi:hypothetical protein FRC06_004460 [Ceratobasidium sp. 370]|nr:hypothetical protein FRC06_004460 [Ceratobasidium sp. 370]
MTSRRPFSIQELAARSRPTGYDPSKSLKDLLRIATAERDAGELAKAANDVESAFIHFAKASTLMLEDLPTHPKFAELTANQKEAVVLHGQMILDSLGAIKPLVSERFSDWRTRHPDADLSAPVPAAAPRQPTRRATQQQRPPQQDTHEEEQRARRARQQQEAQRLVAEQERRQRAQRRERDGAAYDQVANIAATRARERQEKERQEKERLEREEILAEKKRVQEAAMNAATAAAFLGYPTPASLHTRVRPESYEGQTPTPNQPVSIQPQQQQQSAPMPAPSAPPVSIPQAQHFADHLQRSASAAGIPPRTGSAARVYPSHPPTTQPQQNQPTRVPSRTEHRPGSRAEHHPIRPGSRAEQRQMLPAIRTDVFGQRNESAPATYGPGVSKQRRPSMSSPVKDRPPNAGFGFGSHPPTTGPGSHPPTTQAPVPRRRTSSHNAVRGPGPAFPVASAFPAPGGVGVGVGVGVGLDTGMRPNGGSGDARASGGSGSFDVRPNGGSFDARPNGGLFDARPNGGSFDARTNDLSTRANGVFPDLRAQPVVTQPQVPQDILPLESPSRSWTREPEEVQVHMPAPRRTGSRVGQPVRGSSYPPPVTTTSPPPGSISYPDLMSSHQREQGYLPSSHSMFSFAGFAQALAAERDAQTFGPPKPSMNTPPSLLFQPNPDPTPPGGRPAPLPNPYGSTTSSPPKSQQPAQSYAGPGANASGVPTYPGMPQPQAPAGAVYRGGQVGPGPSNYATRPPPAVPSKDYARAPPPIPPDVAIPPIPSTANSPSQMPEEAEDGRLRQVLLPEEVIQKFMSIAKPNTLQNRETCGLLLGKKRGPGFAVTTLLIPRQRATSDTCEMVEEELILDFQESRGLITLGWIHTHPTQSCFMSSLDLHTHSGYQASLKEAFAIVCAPSQSPNVGIFRLTDPPGLQIILKCTVKESFHPHSAANIYTDADQGHVKMMKKLDLSIVDLRRHSY